MVKKIPVEKTKTWNTLLFLYLFLIESNRYIFNAQLINDSSVQRLNEFRYDEIFCFKRNFEFINLVLDLVCYFFFVAFAYTCTYLRVAICEKGFFDASAKSIDACQLAWTAQADMR